MHNANPTLSIGQNMLRIRAALITHPSTVSLKSSSKKVGHRVFSPEMAALVYAVMPPDVAKGKRNQLRIQIACNISRVTGATPEAVKKIWQAEAHRNASLHAMRLKPDEIRAFAEKCHISDQPYLQAKLGL